MKYVRIDLRGIVQGVGFRPFVYRLARRHGLRGSVSNGPQGVTILAAGEAGELESFLAALRDELPPQALIEHLRQLDIPPFEADSFTIEESERAGERSVLVSPDLATCPDCLREIFDPADRRYRYPFTNCTNCGPRYTIIAGTPYDRPATSMAGFVMCEECAREYNDPEDRRFHAQPNACPACGPRLVLTDREGRELAEDPIAGAARRLREGCILAVKGLGGFQLACDATADEAVKKLRERKHRYGKPLAVMVEDLEQAGDLCLTGPEEEQLLASPRAPIVLLPEAVETPLSPLVATGLVHQGVFLPYTPLHHLLLRATGSPLVMTSGNLSGEPIAIRNGEALERLGRVADFFLLHDRDILVRYDDSVSRVFRGMEYPVRRARGYAPYPVRLDPPSQVEVLAVGAELKNTFCLLRGEHAFLGQHIGDLETQEALDHFESALHAMRELFSLEPEVVAHDLHPDYLSTQWAMECPLPRIGVQHHHAHIAACMADNGISGEVLGVAWDGTGYGEDGTAWGGEFLACDEKGYRRLAHLYRYPMPGGDACIYDLRRMAAGALSHVFENGGAFQDKYYKLLNINEIEAAALAFQLEQGVNAPFTSSAGRLFDVVAALLGLRREVLYEGQAACELEAAAGPSRGEYAWELSGESFPRVVDTRPLLREVLDDKERGSDTGEIAGRFHATLASMIVRTCVELGRVTGIARVALSGGVFQNMRLAVAAVEGLERAGLEVFTHRQVPCNDGGVSLGQALIASSNWAER
jgi:hydrogenase maturation protein HypF